MESEVINCPVCGSADYQEIYNGPGRWKYNLSEVICNRCGLCYQNPRPTAKALDEYYENTYRRIKPVHPTTITEQYLNNFSDKRGKYVVKAIERYTDLKKNARIFEIGFGIGAIIHQFHKADYINISGVDSSITHEQFLLLQNLWESRNYQLFKTKLEVFMAGWKLNGERFDLIILHHVLEHVPHPTEAIASCLPMLASNGYLFVATPDFFWPRNGWGNFFVKPHLVTFCRESIQYIWDISGLEVVAQGYHHKAIWQLLKKGERREVQYNSELADKSVRWYNKSKGSLRNRKMIPDDILNYPV